MRKILLAVGHIQLEEYIEKTLSKEYIFVGKIVHKDSIVSTVAKHKPDILVVRETLPGTEDILSVVHELKIHHPKTRIVFLGGDRRVGDAFLSTLVSLGIYDLLYGANIKADEIIRLIRRENEFKDVAHLQMKPKFNEKTNEVLFEAPGASVIEREVIKEVYIGTPEIPTPKTEHIPHLEKEINEISETVEEKEKTETKTEIQKPLIEKIQPEKTEKKEESGKKRSILLGRKDKLVKNDNIQVFPVNKQKIITFMGSKHGTGNSSIALNSAVKLAQKGFKTIFLEISEKGLTSGYLYQLGYLDDGIDSALAGLSEGDYTKINSAIIKSSELKKRDPLIMDSHKKFPETLDFMFFSYKYIRKNEEMEKIEPINTILLKDLYLYLMFNLSYDFIVIDIHCDLSDEATKNALIYSNKIFATITQDISTIGEYVYVVDEIEKQGIEIKGKLCTIINKFEDADISSKEIEEWIESPGAITVPCLNKDFINANFVGVPMVMYSKNSALKNSFNQIEKKIMEI